MKERCRETADKMDCRGLSMTEIKRREEKKKRKWDNMKDDIIKTINLYYSGNGK